MVVVISVMLALLTAASGANALTPQLSPATIYAVPTGLKSTAQTDTSVSLSWTKSLNVPGYRVQVYSKADMSDSAFYRFTDSVAEIRNLVKSTTYQFRIRGIAADGTSLTAYSAPISANTASAPAFAVPTGLLATATSHSSVNVSWNPVANAPG